MPSKITFLDHQRQPHKNLFLDQQQQISEVRSTGRSTDVHNVHSGVGGRPDSRPLWIGRVTAWIGRPVSRPTWRSQLTADFGRPISRPTWGNPTLGVFQSTDQSTVLVFRSTRRSTVSLFWAKICCSCGKILTLWKPVLVD